MTSKKFFAAILMAIMVTVNFASAGSIFAAATDPYCRISYDSSVGCNTVKYYYYVGNTARYDATRLVKFYDGKILLGTSNTQVTANHKAGTNPAWTTDGSYLVWSEQNNSLNCREYGGSTNYKIADNVISLGVNAEHMIVTATLADGSSKNVADLLPKATPTPTVAPTTIPTVAPTTAPIATSTTPTTTPTVAPTEVPTIAPTAIPTKKIQEWTDSAGNEHYQFNGNEVIVNGSDVYFNNFKISELCNSGVRFLGIDSSNRVYLYEDDSSSLYRFSEKNIFSPEKIKFGDGCSLKSINLDSNGFVTDVVTSIGTFKISQLVVDSIWYPTSNYAVNKVGYCSYYVANTAETYTLTLKNSNLYLGTTLVATGLTRTSESFGFKADYLYYLKGSKVYKAPISNPKKATIWKQNVAKLTYSSKTGMVSGVKYLSVKKDYVVNSTYKSVLYQGGKKTHILSISKDRIKLYLDGKLIKKISKAEKKKGWKFKYIGFTEENKIFYCKPYAYKADISSPKKASKWTMQRFKTNSLGFVEKTK